MNGFLNIAGEPVSGRVRFPVCRLVNWKGVSTRTVGTVPERRCLNPGARTGGQSCSALRGTAQSNFVGACCGSIVQVSPIGSVALNCPVTQITQCQRAGLLPLNGTRLEYHASRTMSQIVRPSSFTQPTAMQVEGRGAGWVHDRSARRHDRPGNTA